MDVDDVGFLPYLRRAQEWVQAASWALRTRAWRPDGAERWIAGDLARATWWPAPSPEDEPLETRLRRLVGWASAIRLAMAAGGWQDQLVLSEEVPGKAMLVLRDVMAPPPPDDGAIRLPQLLNALYRPVTTAEDWRLAHDDLGTDLALSAEAAAARMAELVPGLLDAFLPALESLLSDVTVLLTAAARSDP